MKRMSLLILTCILLVTLAGCESKFADHSQTVRDEEASVTDWKKEGFQVGEKVEMDPSRYLQRFQKWEHDPENNEENGLFWIDVGEAEDFFWYLGLKLGADGNIVYGDMGNYVLETWRASDGKRETKEFTPKDVGVNGDLGFFTGMDYLSDGRLALRWAEYEIADELYRQCEDKIILTDLAGAGEEISLWDSLASEQLEQYDPSILPAWPASSFRVCVGDRLCFLRQGEWAKICFYDLSGVKLLEREKDKTQIFLDPFQNEEGELFLPVKDDRDRVLHLFWADLETNGESVFQEVGSLPDDLGLVRKFVKMAGNKIYYQCHASEGADNKDGIVSWDVGSGQRKWVMTLDVNQLSRYHAWWAIEGEEIMGGLLSKASGDGHQEWMVSVSDELPSRKDDVRVADFTGNSMILKKCASAASMENPENAYRYEDASSEDAKTAVRIELSQNGGPDVLFVSLDEFYDYYEKGLLADVGALISEEKKQELLPAALEIGKIDGKTYGIPLGVHLETMLMGKGAYEALSGSGEGKGAEWNLDSAIRLMEQGKLRKAIYSPYIMSSYLDPLTNIGILLSYSLTDSFMVDFEQGKCHFDDERFIKLLELTRTDESKTPHGDGRAEQDDLTWVYLDVYLSLIELMTSGEEGEIVGFPEQNFAGGFLVPEGGILVVNKNCKSMEAAQIFLETMMSDEIQTNNGVQQISIRRFDPKKYITTDYSDEKETEYYFGKIPVDRIDAMDPAENPIQKAVDFLEKSRPAPRKYSDIRGIVMEELQSMYAEGKDAKITAQIIQNRVQIYLNEN